MCVCVCVRARASCIQFEIHACIPEGDAAGGGQRFSIVSFCDGATCVHMPPMQSYAHAYVGDTGPSTEGMGCFSGGGVHHGLLPFLGEPDVRRAGKVNERMMQALSKKTGAPFRGVLQGNFVCQVAGVTCMSFGYSLTLHPNPPIHPSQPQSTPLRHPPTQKRPRGWEVGCGGFPLLRRHRHQD